MTTPSQGNPVHDNETVMRRVTQTGIPGMRTKE